ncbi:uncharacterized protein UV8b_01492 [Ustilaginoidea virens]|uniref:Uncharacterized protein n=1 Tax=Ustilaginoidea virens TaxID=1159556 RepID=A0A8E5MEE0_USTVR|nr:uncharacterized protein UV8b_01492 [Ustilaginoidea virens]QUC17251.1 hypothetical protein UV8b_01492 [Ustilaginoidea virens]
MHGLEATHGGRTTPRSTVDACLVNINTSQAAWMPLLHIWLLADAERRLILACEPPATPGRSPTEIATADQPLYQNAT